MGGSHSSSVTPVDGKVDVIAQKRNSAGTIKSSSNKVYDYDQTKSDILNAGKQLTSIPVLVPLGLAAVSNLLGIAKEVPIIGNVANVLSKFYETCENVASNCEELKAYGE